MFFPTGGLNIEGENDAYDFGTGAGFYVDATKPPYDKGYNMYSYVTEELPQTVFEAFKDQIDSNRVSITGHSMGGHGALTLVSFFSVFLGSFIGDWTFFPSNTYVDTVPAESWQIQICQRFCTHHKSDQLPLGPEGI